MAKAGEVFTVGIQTFESEAIAHGEDAEEIYKARNEFELSWATVQIFVWTWVWQNRKMVVFKVWLWEWKLSKIRGDVFEKAFGPCPFNWKTGPQ